MNDDRDEATAAGSRTGLLITGVSLLVAAVGVLRFCAALERRDDAAAGDHARRLMVVRDICGGFTQQLRIRSETRGTYSRGCADRCVDVAGQGPAELIQCIADYQRSHPLPEEPGPEQRRVALAGRSAEGAGTAYPVATGDVFRDCDEACPEMVVVPPGAFRMGSAQSGIDGGDALPLHDVLLEAELAVGRYPVTRGEYNAFREATGHTTNADCLAKGGRPDAPPRPTPLEPGFAQTDRHPVVCVSWTEARDYALWLSERTGQTYRLLTEAEWEYAVRAGSQDRFPWGPDLGAGHANCPGCGEGRAPQGTTPVEQFPPPNAFGLSDMIGNAEEWVQDCYYSGAYLYASGVASVAFEGTDCDRRVVRGGAWADALGLASGARWSWPGGRTTNTIGFRVARVVAPD